MHLPALWLKPTLSIVLHISAKASFTMHSATCFRTSLLHWQMEVKVNGHLLALNVHLPYGMKLLDEFEHS